MKSVNAGPMTLLLIYLFIYMSLFIIVRVYRERFSLYAKNAVIQYGLPFQLKLKNTSLSTRSFF